MIQGTEGMEDEKPDDMCTLCEGTGIGQFGDPDISRCTICKGRGYVLDGREEDDRDFDMFDYRSRD